MKEVFGQVPIDLHLMYEDISGRAFNDEQVLSPQQSLGPLKMSKTGLEGIEKAIEQMTKEAKRLRRSIESYGEQILKVSETKVEETG